MLAFASGIAPFVVAQQAPSRTASAIRLNQVGFYPEGPKTAAVTTDTVDAFYVIEAEGGHVVHEGTLTPAAMWRWSGEQVRRADFTDLRMPGRYRLLVPPLGVSHEFAIEAHVLRPLAQTTLKQLYFQRASTALPEAYAGPWHRTAGHTDDAVLVHPSAASDGRPAGTEIASPKGWYDAGDYNKYIAPAAFTSYVLLAAFEQYPAYIDALTTHIPESGNALPDLLDEALWNLRWMLTMQDPADGGVYHKLTHAAFSGMVMPEAATAPRYVVQKSTSATLTFAAAMAQASRVYRAVEGYAAFADSCLSAATRAWAWAEAHPTTAYDQGALNAQFDPDISTGAYGDDDVASERAWAAAELALTTDEAAYLDTLDPFPTVIVPYWANSVAYLGAWSLARSEAAVAAPVRAQARDALLTLADAVLALQDSSAYGVAVHEAYDFVWGGNAIVATKAVVLLEAYRLDPKPAYFHGAIALVDYLLGRNATGYSFVTGVGDHTPIAPHHRPSVADGVAEPVPGMLIGGPTSARVGDCDAYPSDFPAKRYLDDVCSYSSNEITTYWNAPLTYAAVAIDALMNR